MMGTIGARDPKKSEDEKSKPFRFRLHPQSEDMAEVGLYRELQARMQGRGSIRQYLIDLYRKAEKFPEKTKPMPLIDTRKIMDKLEKIYNRLQGLSAGAGIGIAPNTDTDYDDDFLSSLDRILDAGLEAGGPVSGDIEYYEDED